MDGWPPFLVFQGSSTHRCLQQWCDDCLAVNEWSLKAFDVALRCICKIYSWHESFKSGEVFVKQSRLHLDIKVDVVESK